MTVGSGGSTLWLTPSFDGSSRVAAIVGYPAVLTAYQAPPLPPVLAKVVITGWLAMVDFEVVVENKGVRYQGVQE